MPYQNRMSYHNTNTASARTNTASARTDVSVDLNMDGDDDYSIDTVIQFIGCRKGRITSFFVCIQHLDLYAVWHTKSGQVQINMVMKSGKIKPIKLTGQNNIKDRTDIENILLDMYNKIF